jgi:hypothetical protein
LPFHSFSTFLPDSQTGLSDHDLLAEQRLRLIALSRRALALAVGRGMLTLFTTRPIITQARACNF